MNEAERLARERMLLRAVLAGDESAWELWYRQSFDGLYAYVRWRCAGLRELADEVVQDTWLTAVRRIRQFDPARGSFAGWLRGIAANLLRNELRRERRPKAALPAQRAEEDVSRREQSERVARALSALPERYESVLRARYLEQQNVADIAAALGQTYKAIESLLTRAREAFRAAYQLEDHEHERA